MALHFGWFGNTDGGPDNDQLKLMEDPNPANAYYNRGTAIDRYMWFGLRTLGACPSNRFRGHGMPYCPSEGRPIIAKCTHPLSMSVVTRTRS